MSLIKLTSKSLVNRLERRAAQVKGRTVAAALVLPDEIGWVNIQEHGTVKKDYPIRARDGGALALPAAPPEYPNVTITPKVIHPGLKPQRFVAKVLPEIRSEAGKRLKQAIVESDYQPDEIQSALTADVMPKVIDLIGTSLGETLGPSEPEGKLKGQSPEEVYRNKVEIVEQSL